MLFFVHNDQKKGEVWKTSLLDKAEKKVYNNITVERGVPRERVENILLLLWKEEKKRKSKWSPFREEERDELKKLFKKDLTKGRKSDIIIKLPQKSGADHEKLFEKNLKKYLTKRKESDIILKLSRKRERHRKKLLKKLEKVLDKQFWMWYNIKAARKGNGNSILKIEQYKEKV